MYPWDHPLSSALLLPLSLLYGAAVRLRGALYRKGVLEVRKLPTGVLSVGNLTVGGSGKTPLVATIAKGLKTRGWRVAVLSRGYRGRREGEGAVVSDGDEIFLGAEEAGDEPSMLARALPGVAVAVGRDRYRMGMELWRRFRPQVVILDDGFQHLRLWRDLDLVAIAADTDPSRLRLLPAGPLREPLSALRRADALVITYCPPGGGIPEVEEALRDAFPHPPIFHAEARYRGFVEVLSGKEHPVEALKGLEVSALCATARPERFFRALEQLGLRVVSRTVCPDHHRWRRRELEEASALGEALVTTDKDAQRLPSPPKPCYILKMELTIRERAFWEMVQGRLKGEGDDLRVAP